MNTSGVRDSLLQSYSPLAKRKQSPNQQISLLDEEPPYKNLPSNSDKQTTNTAIKISTQQILNLNNTKGILGSIKNNVIELGKEISRAIKTPKLQNFNKLEKAINNTTTSVYNNEIIINRQIILASDNSDIAINIQIKKPPIESMDDVYQLQLQTKKTLQQINEIQSYVESRVDKKIESMNHSKVKVKKEFEQKRLDDAVNTTQAFKDISSSETIQKELLWLLR